ncbi:MAG: phosphoribosyltransferase family protein [Aquisalimonadaceae bacterium]
MPDARETYRLVIGAVVRELPLLRVDDGLRIAVLNILGDTELTEVAATGLAARLASVDYDVLVTAEAKSIPLAHALSVRTGMPYVVLRKAWKPYMGDALQATTVSITTGVPQTLYLDVKDFDLLVRRRVVLLDDVVSTGSTLRGMRRIMDQANVTVAATAAICTEGDAPDTASVIALAHLPLFRD